MEGKTRRRSGTPGSGGVPALEALFSVSFEHVGKSEALAAHAAGVGLLSGMCPAVALHVGPTGEAFAADLTDERFLSCSEEKKERAKPWSLTGQSQH